MPFDFKAYDAKCNGLTPEELQREWEHYTRLISGASTSTAVSGLAVPFTLGVSTVGVAMAAPAIHNARKKRAIIEKHLQNHNTTHVTRKRDVLGSMAVSGTIGVVTLGVGSMGADAVATAGAEHGISAVVENETAIKIVTHAALDGVGMGIEHAHTNHLKKKDAVKAFQAAGVFVENAKAAEAGYSIQPYNPQNFTSASNMATMVSPQPPPPPPYNANLQRPPNYYRASNIAYPSDSKTPAIYAQSTTASQIVPHAAPSLYDSPQLHNRTHPHFQMTCDPRDSIITPTSAIQPEGSDFAVPTNPIDSQLDVRLVSSTPTHSNPASHQPELSQNGQACHQPQSYAAVGGSAFHITDSSYISTPGKDVYNVESITECLSALDTSTDTAKQETLLKPRNPITETRPESLEDNAKPQSGSVHPQSIDHGRNSHVQSSTPAPEILQYQPQQANTQSQHAYPQEHQPEPSPLSILSVSSTPNRIEVPQYASQHTLHSYPSPPLEPAHQPYADYVDQGRTGNTQQQSIQSVPPLRPWRHSLQPSISPSSLSRHSQQYTLSQSSAIPYFPPPPGQQEGTHPPATYPAHQTLPQRHSHRQTFREIQYPPVPVPSPYGTTTHSTPYQGQAPMPIQHQQYPPIPQQSKLQQQALTTQYQVPGYLQNPLTPPYSPPQSVQQTGTSYFAGGVVPQYQNMYQTPHR